MVEDPGVCQEDVQQPGTLAQLERVAALVGEKGAHVDGEVLLVWERREEGETQSVIVRLLVEVGGESVVGPLVVCNQMDEALRDNSRHSTLTRYPVLGLVITSRYVLNYPPLSLPTSPTVLLVKVGVGLVLLLLPEKVIFLVGVEIPDK